MEMDEFEAVVHAFFVEKFECLEKFATGESELAGIAAAIFPFAATRRSEFYPNAEVWFDLKFFCNSCNGFQFIQFLDHNEDPFAHFLCEQGQFDITLVFISIADDERVALALHCYHGMQFGF